MILALPDSLLEVLPKNTLRLSRPRRARIERGTVTKLTLLRGGKHHGARARSKPPNDPNQWRMAAPVKAPADVAGRHAAYGACFPTCGPMNSWPTWPEREGLRARPAVDRGLVADSTMPRPRLGHSGQAATRRAKPNPWFSPRHRQARPAQARVRSTRPSTVCRSPSRSARSHHGIPGRVPRHPGAVVPRRLDPPAHPPPARPQLAFTRSPRPTGGPTDWTAEPGTDLKGIDLSRFSDLVKQLSQLRTTRFYQYERSRFLPEPACSSRGSCSSFSPPTASRPTCCASARACARARPSPPPEPRAPAPSSSSPPSPGTP